MCQRYFVTALRAGAVLAAVLALAVGCMAGVKETVLYNFVGQPYGSNPNATMISDGQGNFYGTDQGGVYNRGEVFELSPDANGGWTVTTLYSFSGSTDGGYPKAGIIMDRQGTLYGTTAEGGQIDPDSYCGSPTISGCGVVFELNKSNGVWHETVLYAFQGQTDGMNSWTSLTLHNGRIYGTTVEGGNGGPSPDCCFGSGTVFELVPSKNASWTENVIYRFDSNGAGPAQPETNVVFDKSGNVYGTTYWGTTNGECGGGGCGVVFELTPGGTTWPFSVLHNFTSQDGAYPMGNLTIDSHGNVYGATEAGGPMQGGVAFEVTAGTSGWTETVLHDFGENTDGAMPLAGLTLDTHGNLYGSTFYGGGLGTCGSAWPPSTCGTVFALKPNSNGGWTEIILHRFSGGADGSLPIGGATLDPNGNVFGVTDSGGRNNSGTVFELSR